MVIAGFQDNGTARFNATQPPASSWTQVDNLDGGFALFDTVNPTFAYHTFATTAAGAWVSRSTDGGVTFNSAASSAALQTAMATAGDRGAAYFPPLASDPAVAQRVLFGAHSVYVSNDAMATWSRQTTQDLTGGCNSGECATRGSRDRAVRPHQGLRARDGNQHDFSSNAVQNIHHRPGQYAGQRRPARRRALDRQDRATAANRFSGFHAGDRNRDRSVRFQRRLPEPFGLHVGDRDGAHFRDHGFRRFMDAGRRQSYSSESAARECAARRSGVAIAGGSQRSHGERPCWPRPTSAFSERPTAATPGRRSTSG